MMSTTIVAAQHSFDELLGQMGRKVSMAEIEGRKVEPGERERIEQWLAGMVKRTIDYLRVETESPVSADELEQLFAARLDAVEPRPTFGADAEQAISSHGDNLAAFLAMGSLSLTARSEFLDHYRWTRRRWRQLTLWAWPERQWLAYEGQFYRIPTDEPPDDELLQFLGAIDVLEIGNASPAKTAAARSLRPSITPGFRYNGHEGLGRISTSQISMAIFTACIAPKAEWEQTVKGWPRYTFRVPSGDIIITLRPDVVSHSDIAGQIADMIKLRDALRIDTWDLMCILQDQAMTENRPDASAFITDNAALDYRMRQPKKAGRYLSNHHPKMQAHVADCMRHITHMHVRTDTLKIRQAGPGGVVKTVRVDWDYKVLEVHGGPTRRDTDTALGWHYSFNALFTTFLEKPNRYVGYLLQKTIALSSKKETTKTLCHYLAFHLRADAYDGPWLVRSMGELMDGIKLKPIPGRGPSYTIDLLENAVREVVQLGHARMEWDGIMFDSQNAAIATWTGLPTGVRPKDLLRKYRDQRIVFRAVPDIEEIYDREIRHGRHRAKVPQKAT